MRGEVLETIYLRDEIGRCEDLEELQERIFPLLQTQKERWGQFIRQLIQQKGLVKSQFAKDCDVSRMTLDKWCKGAIPKNRETFLRVGMAANLTVAEMNQMLQRCGRYPALYSKSLEDCICLFVLNHNENQDALRQFSYVYERITNYLEKADASNSGAISTLKFDRMLSEVDSSDMLETFIAENIDVFSYSYHAFYAYVKMFLRANNYGYAGNVFELAETQGWSSSLRQCVSAIRQNKWYPTRNKIISLGLHLSMDHEQIDEMLGLAHMEPLCAKNIFECIVIFLLEDAQLNDIIDLENDLDALCRYAKKVMSQLKIPEIAAFFSEIAEIDDVW